METDTDNRAETTGAGAGGGLKRVLSRLGAAARGDGGAAAAMPVRAWEIGWYAALIAVGLAMRLWDLGSRALHHDESLHALYSWKLIAGDGYQHNPMMHGPFQFQANAALFLVFGDSDATSRLLYAAMGAVLIGMPFLLRSRLGRLGALLAATGLAASPAMLYFSRFARNDILMAVWTFGLVICMWRYFDEGRVRWLYVSAALLALAFATKESAYLVTATLGLWALLMAMRRGAGAGGGGADAGEFSRGIIGASPPVALARAVKRLWASYGGALAGAGVNEGESEGENGGGGNGRRAAGAAARPAAFLVLLITLTLPQWSAFAAVLQDAPPLSWTGLTLAAPEGSPSIGDPVGGGIAIAFAIVAAALALSFHFGRRWGWSVWWRCAALFYAIWILFYTTFLTNFAGGIASGVWQSLGYWIVQQGEARGGQPWHYYIVISSIYEFLPILVGLAGAVYYLRKREAFGVFLAFWALVTFALYTIASEKMPWLLVNITLPFIILSGKTLADAIENTDWRRIARTRTYWLIPALIALIALLGALALYDAPDGGGAVETVGLPLALVLSAAAMAALIFFCARAMGRANALWTSLLAVAALLLVLSVRAGAVASYQNGDTPVEMLVYTQTSPDIPRLLRSYERAGAGAADDLRIEIDGSSGFSWPWAWYFRGEGAAEASFATYGPDTVGRSFAERTPVILVHSSNRQYADESAAADAYGEARRIRHRWWFPEHVYRDLTPVGILTGLFDRSAWRGAVGYWLNRDGVRHMVGSEDSFLYFRDDVPIDYEPSP